MLTSLGNHGEEDQGAMLKCTSRNEELREQNRVNKVITQQLKEEKR